MKKKQSAAGMFFSVFLKAIIVILAVVIVILGVLIVKNIIQGKKMKDARTTSAPIATLTDAQEDELLLASDPDAEPQTEEATVTQIEEEKPAGISKEDKIVVINASGADGMAGTWRTKMNDLGFTNVAIGSYAEVQETTVIYAESEDAAAEIKAAIPGASVQTGTPDAGSISMADGTTDDAKVYVVLGTDVSQ